MAASIKFLNSSYKLRKLLMSPQMCMKSFARTLLCANKLGVNDYERHQLYKQEQVGEYKGKFLTKFAEKMGQKETSMFTEDIKTMIYLAETDEHFDLVIKAYTGYMENKQMDPSPRPFYFAPLIMHMLHKHNQTDLAKKLLLHEISVDPKSDFGTIRCVRLLMDLLYQENRLSEIVNLWPLCDTQLNIGYHVDIETYVFVSLYLMNTKEALEKCMAMISSHPRWQLLESPKCYACTTMLALNQNDPEMAMEIMSSTLFNRTIDTEEIVGYSGVDPARNLYLENFKMLTYLKLDRVEEAFYIMSRLASTSTQQTDKKYVLSITTVEAFDEKIKAHDDHDLTSKYLHIRQSLDRADLISTQTLHDYIVRPVYGKMNSLRPNSHARARVRLTQEVPRRIR